MTGQTNNCVFLMVDSLRFDAVNAIEPDDEGYLHEKGLRETLETPSFDYLVDQGATITRTVSGDASLNSFDFDGIGSDRNTTSIPLRLFGEQRAN